MKFLQNETPPLSHLSLLLVASYVAAQMLADVASLKIGVVAGWAVDMGTFIYPLTFTLRDVVHKTLGKRSAQVLIVSAALINAFMALYFWGSTVVASDLGWASSQPGVDMGLAFAAIFTPVWRIVLASIVAEVVSELLDTEAYHWFVTRISREHLWARVVVSNVVSVPVDSAIFCLLAFYGDMPSFVVWEIFVFNVVLKFALTLFSIPLVYLGREGVVSPPSVLRQRP